MESARWLAGRLLFQVVPMRGCGADEMDGSMERIFDFTFGCSFALGSVDFGTRLHGQMPGMPQSRHHAWSDTSLSPDVRADLVIKELTLDEKIQLLHGLGWLATVMPPESGPGTRAISRLGFIPGIPRLDIPDLQMSDSVVGFQERA